jgi:3-hydroxybutyryl-CoA dehydratase
MTVALHPTARVNLLSAITQGQEAVLEFSVTADEMQAFAELSGDYNPLHCDIAFARERGFGERVVYGALLVAKISRLIGMELPGRDSLWSGLELLFVSPLLVGEEAVLKASVVHISEATRSLELRLRILSGERVIARGKAGVSIRNGG